MNLTITMKWALLPVVLVLVLNLPKSTSGTSTLKLAHVIFRHGNRNPEKGSIWPGNSYDDESYYPEGPGQLTNKGKLTEYNLGKFLRKRWDSFLGDIWNINIQDFRSTGVNRTKMSGVTVMAGLWPPKGSNVWNAKLLWQPIPYNYESTDNDPLLYGFGCPSIGSSLVEVFNDPEISSYLNTKYADAIKIVSENTGVLNPSTDTLISYFDVMKVQEDLGFKLDSWVEQVYPEPLNSLAVEYYNILTNTTRSKQIFSGNFLKKILADTKSFIDGTLSPSSRKLFVYSAHDINIGTILTSLNAYTLKYTPPYGATIIFELHQILGIYGFKLFYVDYTFGSPHPLSIPGCSHFCPFDYFRTLINDIIPTTDGCNDV
ncbi:hypothetical protein ABEB36_013314 [Hypothenemus hampei]|uniref:acid phosphatase n=1 Tax=Hypothenemus hampei TaxID=57062 RepID=A0ABD1E7U6_HYPHA